MIDVDEKVTSKVQEISEEETKELEKYNNLKQEVDKFKQEAQEKH